MSYWRTIRTCPGTDRDLMGGTARLCNNNPGNGIKQVFSGRIIPVSIDCVMIIRSIFMSLFVIVGALSVGGTVWGQTETFSSPEVEYTFEVPNERWKMTVKPSSTTPNVEFVFGDRNDGHLAVRRVNMPSRGVLSDLIKDEEQRLLFLNSFVAGKEEPFGGFLNGTIFNFEFVRAGRQMAGRFYFLRSGENHVYVLRFTGFRDSMRSIRNQTDLIARTFNVRKQ